MIIIVSAGLNIYGSTREMHCGGRQSSGHFRQINSPLAYILSLANVLLSLINSKSNICNIKLLSLKLVIFINLFSFQN